MKRTILTALSILVFSAAALAQAPTDEIEKALTPLQGPQANLKDGATVIKWKADFTYDTLRKGTNKMVCYDRSGQPGQQPFAVECTSIANLERVAQSLKIEAANPDAKAKRAAFEEFEKAGKWTKPEVGSVWIHVTGQNATATRKHLTIAMPGATNKTTGLPEDNKQGGVWIMDAGSSEAHLMIPGN
jgi:hypothetical protein